MRTIKTFILRLYMDLEWRDQICGDLRALPGSKAFPFKNEAELFVLVHRLAIKEEEDLTLKETQEEHQPKPSGSQQPVE